MCLKLPILLTLGIVWLSTCPVQAQSDSPAPDYRIIKVVGKVDVAGQELKPRPLNLYLTAGTPVRVSKDSLLELQIIGSPKGAKPLVIGPNGDVPGYRLPLINPAQSSGRVGRADKEIYRSAALDRDLAAGDCPVTRDALATPSCGSVIPPWVDFHWTPGKPGDFVSFVFTTGSDTLSRSVTSDRGILAPELYVKFLEDHQHEKEPVQIKVVVKQTGHNNQELIMMLLGDAKERELLMAERQAEKLNLMDELMQKAELRAQLGLYREAYGLYQQLLLAQPGNLTAERKLADLACLAFGQESYLVHIRGFSDAEKRLIPCRH